jgi:hypothetical protein
MVGHGETDVNRRGFLSLFGAVAGCVGLGFKPTSTAPTPKMAFHKDAFSFVWPHELPRRMDVLFGHAIMSPNGPVKVSDE